LDFAISMQARRDVYDKIIALMAEIDGGKK
jgi:hypothetical protein